MTGAVFVIAINMAITMTMAIAFFAVGHFDPRNRAANWFGVAFILAMLSFVGEYILFAGLSDAGARLFIALSMLACFLVITHAVKRRYEMDIPDAGLFAIFLASAVLYAMILDLPRQDVLRQVLYQTPYALVTAMGMFIVLRSGRYGILDRALLVVLFLVFLSFVSKPVIAHYAGGVGSAGRDYATTLYALVSQASGAVAALLLAMVCLAMVVSDTASALIKRSERDVATGLLNQHGFDVHGARVITDLLVKGRHDLALVLFSFDPRQDLDMPPEPGVALGDDLTGIFGPEATIARLSGCRFAAMLPGTNLFSARRHAEMLRARTVAGTISVGVPARASIGIAEMEAGDSLSSLMGRAQWAHDEARKAGGDCVRLAARAAFSATGVAR